MGTKLLDQEQQSIRSRGRWYVETLVDLLTSLEQLFGLGFGFAYQLPSGVGEPIDLKIADPLYNRMLGKMDGS